MYWDTEWRNVNKSQKNVKLEKHENKAILVWLNRKGKK